LLIREYAKKKFQTNDVRIVDGPYDGGNDLEIYKNGKDIKRNIQITVQKDRYESKLNSDLQKAKDNVINYSYLRNLQFFISQNIPKDTRNEIELKAELDYDIVLDIFDANLLSQEIEKNEALVSFLYALHGIKDNRDLYFDKNTKIIFDVLTHNINTVEIKKNFINSHIYSFLLSNPESSLQEIVDYICTVFENKIEKDYIEKEINYLRIKQLIVTNRDTKMISLSPEKENEIQKIYEHVSSEESLLINNLETFIFNEGLSIDFKTLLDYLYKIYQENYNIDIEEVKETTNSFSNPFLKSYNDLIGFFTINKIEEKRAGELANKLLKICGESEFLTKYSTVHLFNNLFSSNKLEKYLDSKQQKIFIDTQILLRLLCVIYPKKGYSFKDSALNSVNLFYNTSKRLNDQLFLLTSQDYILEVAIHIANAVKLKRFMDLPFLQKMGTTKNVFYNAYLEFSEVGLLDSMTSFTEFLSDLLDIELDNIENETHDNLINTIFNCVIEIIEYLGIEIVNHEFYGNYQSIKREYEIYLANASKERAYNAIQNDLRTILYLSTQDNHINDQGIFEEPYLLTWDSSFYSIRKALLAQKSKLNCSFWYIYSPLKLVDRLSIMNFNLNPEMLSLNIIALTENNFNYSSKKASFIDVISSFFNSEDVSQSKIIQKLAKLNNDTKSNNKDEDNAKEFSENDEESPILKILLDLRNHYSSSTAKYNFKDLTSMFENNNFELEIMEILKNSLKSYKFENISIEFDNLIESSKKVD
jgi:hypothetical protein